jgi:hypothetical protein
MNRKMETRVEIGQEYLDIDKVFEKLSLAQKTRICIVCLTASATLWIIRFLETK